MRVQCDLIHSESKAKHLFDFKKEYKEFYLPKKKPEIVCVPRADYIAVKGSGDPNEEGGAYKQAIGMLYAVAYTLKMSYKSEREIAGFYEYVIPPLEGFWWQDGISEIDYANKSSFRWISVIRLPEFITADDVEWANAVVQNKKKLDCADVQFVTIDEGLCVQIMHIGSFDTEPDTVEHMTSFLTKEGYETDFSHARLHHEIYLSDARRVAAEKWRTVIRHPIRKVLKVEIGREENIEAWMTLVRKLQPEFPGLETDAAMSEHRQTVLRFMREKRALCVRDNGKIVGVLLLSTKHNMICFLGVDKEYRRRGIGEMLVRAALSRMDYSRSISVTTFRDGDPKGIAPRGLYKKLGFVEAEFVEELGYPNQRFVIVNS